MFPLPLVMLALAGPPSLSLEEAMRLAAERLPAVAAAERRVRAAEALQHGATAQPNPELRLGVAAGEPDSRTNEVVQRLEVAGQPGLRATVATHDVGAALQDLRQARRIAAREAALAWYGLWEARQRRGVAEEQVRLAESLAAVAQRRYEVGEIARNEELRTRLERDRASGALLQAEGEERSALARLNLSLGGEWDAEVVLAEANQTPFGDPGPLPDLLSRAAERPEVEAARFAARAAEAQVRLTERGRLPDVELSLGQPRLGSAEGRSASVALVVPLWDWGSLGAQAAAGRARAQALMEDAEEAARLARLDVAEAWTSLQTASAQRELTRRLAGEQGHLVAMARKGYDAGLLTLVDVLETQRAAREAALAAVAAEAEYFKARVQLQWASAGPLPGERP